MNKRAMLRELEREISNCERCDVGRREKRRIGYKLPLDLEHADSEVMFIGICPGDSWFRAEKDMKNPRPVRRSDFIRLLEEEVGIDSKSFYGTNIVKCACVSNPNALSGNNRNPIILEILHCSPFLDREIEILRPRLIVTIGRIPAEYFGIRQSGKHVKNKELKCHILSVRHYSNQRNGREQLRSQLEKVKEIVRTGRLIS